LPIFTSPYGTGRFEPGRATVNALVKSTQPGGESVNFTRRVRLASQWEGIAAKPGSNGSRRREWGAWLESPIGRA